MSQGNQDLTLIIYPWTFVLKEGKICDNSLDYSLVMLRVSEAETLRSPNRSGLVKRAYPRLKVNSTQAG